MDETSPAYVMGGFQPMFAATRVAPKAVEVFRTGDGIGWHEHDPDLFEGTERSSARVTQQTWSNPGSPPSTALTPSCEPTAGRPMSAAGTGRPRSLWLWRTELAALGLPLPRAVDPTRRRGCSAAGLSDRVHFEVAAAKEYPGKDFDLVCHFDRLHDMGDPVGAAHTPASRSRPTAPAAGRAIRQRRPRGQPQPHWARLLLGIDADLHAGFAVSGGGRRAWSPGRREPAQGGSRGSRLLLISPSHGDAVQSGLRGTTLAPKGRSHTRDGARR